MFAYLMSFTSMLCEFCVNQIMSNTAEAPRNPENCSGAFSTDGKFAGKRGKLTAWSERGVASWLPCTYKPKRKIGRLYAGVLNGLTTKERAYKCKCYKNQSTTERYKYSLPQRE